MIYIVICTSIKVILSEFMITDKDAIANDCIDAIWTTWVVIMGATRKRVCRHPLF